MFEGMHIMELLQNLYPNAKTIEIKDGNVFIDGKENQYITVSKEN